MDLLTRNEYAALAAQIDFPKGIHTDDQYTELKTIWVDLSDPAAGDKIA